MPWGSEVATETPSGLLRLLLPENWRSQRGAEACAEACRHGVHHPTLWWMGDIDLLILSRLDARSDRRLFGMLQADRLSHAYIIGKTGTGKSTLLEHLLCQDIEAGRGAALIDPHGQIRLGIEPRV